MFTPDDRDRLIRVETLLAGEVDIRKDHEKRLRKVEGRLATWSGAGSAIGLIIGWIAKGHLG
jgi:hypothetical protein